ncbi:uncharacterized protein V1478_009216 [Vespula squamosa]|uniref:MADF domain-containing protein n=1 Tax=Vespula squamosa TaxID=30214 RepID=A0ABD2AP10_VESSQ
MSKIIIWNNELIIKLIDQYKKYECLWIPSNKHYKCKNIREDAWKKISSVIKVDIVQVKQKMKNLSAQFYRERRKKRSMKNSGGEGVFISKWFAYNSMLYLSNRSMIRKRSHKDLSEKMDTSSESSESDTKVSSNNLEILHKIEDINKECNQQNQTMKPETWDFIKKEHCSNISTKEKLIYSSDETKKFESPPKKKAVTKENNIQYDINEDCSTMKRLNYNKEYRDRFTVFGEHVAYKLRSLRTEHSQNMVEHIICNILWEASMGNYDQSPFLQNSSSPS